MPTEQVLAVEVGRVPAEDGRLEVRPTRRFSPESQSGELRSKDWPRGARHG
jgi:hypothetical protein